MERPTGVSVSAGSTLTAPCTGSPPGDGQVPHQDWCLLLCVGTLSTARAPQDDLQQATGLNVSDIIFCALDRAEHPDCDRHADCNLVQHDRFGCQSVLDAHPWMWEHALILSGMNTSMEKSWSCFDSL